MITAELIQEAIEQFREGPINCEEWAEAEGIELREIVEKVSLYLIRNADSFNLNHDNLTEMVTALTVGIKFGVYAGRKEQSEILFNGVMPGEGI